MWGKILGGVGGLSLGGPIGAIIGVALGHAYDRSQSGAKTYADVGTADKQAAFGVAVVVLSAKMAKADGAVTRDEIATFKRLFPVPADEASSIARIFDQARKEVHGFSVYATQLREMYGADCEILEEILFALFVIAAADGVVCAAEWRYLEQVAVHFGFSPSRWSRFRASCMRTHTDAGHTRRTFPQQGRKKKNAYQVLGVSENAGPEEVRVAYHNLVKQYHPDKLAGLGLPEDFTELANRRLSAINEAWKEVRSG